MNRSLDYYLGLFRKHWIQILLIATLTGVGGYFYLQRQEPVFKATTKLRIIRQKSRSARDVSFTFEEDQIFYNTQYDLLRTNIDWADMLLNRVAYRIVIRLGNGSADEALRVGTGMTSDQIVKALDEKAGDTEFHPLEPKEWHVDQEVPKKKRELLHNLLMDEVGKVREQMVAGRLKLNPDSFLAGITARPIPGTHLAELSYQAKDPGVAVVLVNMYAELYRDVSMGERKGSIEQAILLREDRLAVLGRQLREAEDAEKDAAAAFTNKEGFGHLNPYGNANPFESQADAVGSTRNEKQIEQLVRAEEEQRLKDVLEGQGFEILNEGNRIGKADGGDATTLHVDLADNLAVLADPIVGASTNVKDVRARLQECRDERARLLERFTPGSDEVRQAEKDIKEARIALGREVEATILRYLRAGRDLDDVIAVLGERLVAKQTLARKLNDEYQKVAGKRKAAEALRRDLAALAEESKALAELSQGVALTGSVAIQNIRIELRARLRDAPQIRPNPMLIIVFTVLAALVLSFGSVFLVEFFDDTIKTKEDFDRHVAVPDLGFIPRIGEKEFKRRDGAVLEKPRSSVAEAFRSLRTGINFSRRDEEIRCFLVSSAGPGEGKTTVTTNLAITMAEAGRGKVLVIDADLRKARLHKALGIENGPGLTNCLVGSATLEEVARPTEVENLYVVTSGPTPPNPAELLGGHRMAEVLEQAKSEYLKVIIDTPPLVAVTDTSLLAPLVEGVFLVVSMGKTSWRLIDRAKQSLAAVGEAITGGIVNDVRSSHRGYGYGYGYTYDRYYGNPEDGEE